MVRKGRNLTDGVCQISKKVAQMFPTYDTINDTINGTISHKFGAAVLPQSEILQKCPIHCPIKCPIKNDTGWVMSWAISWAKDWVIG